LAFAAAAVLLAADHLQCPLDHMDVVDDLETDAAVNQFICPLLNRFGEE
jgi:hypothetical protein